MSLRWCLQQNQHNRFSEREGGAGEVFNSGSSRAISHAAAQRHAETVQLRLGRPGLSLSPGPPSHQCCTMQPRPHPHHTLAATTTVATTNLSADFNAPVQKCLDRLTDAKWVWLGCACLGLICMFICRLSVGRRSGCASGCASGNCSSLLLPAIPLALPSPLCCFLPPFLPLGWANSKVLLVSDGEPLTSYALTCTPYAYCPPVLLSPSPLLLPQVGQQRHPAGLRWRAAPAGAGDHAQAVGGQGQAGVSSFDCTLAGLRVPGLYVMCKLVGAKGQAAVGLPSVSCKLGWASGLYALPGWHGLALVGGTVERPLN